MNVEKAYKEVGEHVLVYGNDKYQHSIIDTEASLKEPRFTLLTATKYLSRYVATSGEKRRNPQDLRKAIHFILFELQNRIDNDSKDTQGSIHVSEVNS